MDDNSGKLEWLKFRILFVGGRSEYKPGASSPKFKHASAGEESREEEIEYGREAEGKVKWTSLA